MSGVHRSRALEKPRLGTISMKELHTPGPWDSDESTEDYQGHFITGNRRTVATTYTKDPADITQEDSQCELDNRRAGHATGIAAGSTRGKFSARKLARRRWERIRWTICRAITTRRSRDSAPGRLPWHWKNRTGFELPHRT
jgi:hypothetical protein